MGFGQALTITVAPDLWQNGVLFVGRPEGGRARVAISPSCGWCWEAGFWGSGETTLIWPPQRRSLRSAMVWNDPGMDLVDSRHAALSRMHSGEVTGGCFCCRLSQVIDAISALRAYASDVIYPVECFSPAAPVPERRIPKAG